MAQNKFSEVWDGLPPWAKGITVVGSLVLGTVVGFKIYKSLHKTQAEKQSQSSVNNASQDLQKLVDAGMKPTYLGSQYSTWASDLEGSLSGCISIDSWQDSIKSVFAKMNNTADILALIQAFNIREYKPCWLWSPAKTIASWWSSPKGDLAWWLKTTTVNESDSDVLPEINAMFAQKGINYSFQ